MAKQTYSQIGSDLFDLLLGRLESGSHLALLGPRNSGKALVLEELAQRSLRQPEPVRPQVVRLMWDDFRTMGEERFVRTLAQRLGVEARSLGGAATPLSGKLDRLFERLLRNRLRPLWLFVQDILGFPVPIARELLNAFHQCKAGSFQERLAVVVTGSADFIPLTYGQLSPYRHAEQFVLRGTDRDYAARFYCCRRMRQRGELTADPDVPPEQIDLDREITPKAFDYLYEQTGGCIHLIQEIVVTAARHPYTLQHFELGGRWNLQQTRTCVKSFVESSMQNDFFCRMALREVEHMPESFELLMQVLREGKAPLPGAQPHQLEVSGLLRRERDGMAVVFSPIWHRFLKRSVNGRHVADVYAWQRQWDKAWACYRRLPAAQRFRPVSGHATFRLRSVLSRWRNSFAAFVDDGPEAVCEQFYLGAKYLLGFDAGGLYHAPGSPPCDEPPNPKDLVRVSSFGQGRLFVPEPGRPSVAIPRDDGAKRRDWLDNLRTSVYSDPQIQLSWTPESRPVLSLERRGFGRDIDSAEQKKVSRVLGHFWHAYDTACKIEFRQKIGLLYAKHYEIMAKVNRLLANDPLDMGDVVRGAAEALIQEAGYFRVLICLVDPLRERIEAVAQAHHRRAAEFHYKTNYALNDGAPIEQCDVQPWVVRKGEICVVRDASSSGQVNPATNWRRAAEMGMKAIAVVPMRIGDEVIGTIHLERQDREVPSSAECDLFRTLASQIAAVFHQAKRLMLLQQSVSVLTDKIRIVDAQRQILFLNQAAADDGEWRPGWQARPLHHRCLRRSEAESSEEECLIRDVARGNRPVHRYHILPGEETRAHDWLMAPIDDFRAALEPPFEANGRIGYVERIHDLSGLYSVVRAFQDWLTEQGTRETARRILGFFEREGFQWGRIYLVQKTQDEEWIESFEQFGMRNQGHRNLFRDGGVRYARGGKDPQPWHAIEVTKDLTTYEERKGIRANRIVEAPPANGLPRFQVREAQSKRNLEKGSAPWIEAPLCVGQRCIGKLSISMPTDLRPAAWELLRIAVAGAAAALDEARRSEEDAERAVEEAWKTSSAMAAHQLAAKVGAARSFIKLAERRCTDETPQVEDFLRKARISLDRAFHILDDFKQYAADNPFEDTEVVSVWDLLKEGRANISDQFPGVGAVRLVGRAPRVSVDVSRRAFFEVLEILAENSIKHGKPGVRLELGAALAEPPAVLQAASKRFVRIACRDNGRGVPSRNKETIFHPFRTYHPQGTGLGLSIARRHVRRLGGEMTEEGRYGQGACFMIYLPVIEKGG
ncbi:MAG: GAF domain-containing protein [Nitrospiraceae bacterium]|nr:GAF domain-containing protein [Nitrospiraceae bacterium]